MKAETERLLREYSEIEKKIRKALQTESDGKAVGEKNLVGLIGEIGAKPLLEEHFYEPANLEPDDSKNYDIIVGDKRISVKSRRGKGKGYFESGTISEGNKQNPTHLLFVLLNEDCSLSGAWLFDWAYLDNNKRIMKKGKKNVFYLRESKDHEFRIT